MKKASRHKKAHVVARQKKRVTRNRIEESQNHVALRPLMLISLWLLFIGVALYIALWSPYLSLTHIVISGNERTTFGPLYETAVEAGEGSTAWGMKNNHYLLYPVESVARVIREQFPFIESVELTKRFPDTLLISLVEVEDLVVICPTHESRDGCWEVGRDGAVGRAVDFSAPRYQNNQLMTIVAEPGMALHEGADVMTTDVRSFLPEFTRELQFTLGIRIEGRYAMSTAARGDFVVRTDEGWELRFDATDSLPLVIERMSILFQRTDIGASRSDVEYIDMRFGDRIFYKKREVAPESENVSAEASQT